MTSPETELMLAYLEDRRLDEAVDYVRRGRAHENETVEHLEQEWLAGFRAWVASSANDELFDRRSLDDIEAEMYLRRMPPPFERVQYEIEALRAAQDRRFRLLAHDPEALMRLNRRMGTAVENFARRLHDSKKN
jgi:hypothetical protein